ncbi:MAG TPA: helix-turn-helix domain-containing protein [Acidobacteriota bacterium]|nr:helix-turn-helix domain-containing protein [Acidobacteriota bacterium]
MKQARDVYFVENVEQASLILQPLRLELLKRLKEPKGCPELAAELGASKQKVYYHVKKLEECGAVEMVRERRVKGIMEGIYQAKAKSFWFSPGLVRSLGGSDQAKDQASLGFLLRLAEDLHTQVGRLAASPQGDTPSLGINGRIELADATRRAEFMEDVQKAFRRLARKYGRRDKEASRQGEDAFRLMLACYPDRPSSK